MTLATVVIIAFACVAVLCFVVGYYAGQNAMKQEIQPMMEIMDDIHSGVEELREWNQRRTP